MFVVARITLGTAMALTPGVPDTVGHAMAAGSSDPAGKDARSDRIQAQDDAVDAAQEQSAAQTAPPVPREFNLRVIAPLYYNTNATQAQSGGPAALEGDPEIELGWARSMASMPLKLSMKLRADTDRYSNVSLADEDEISASLRASYYDAQNDQAWAPFLSYKSAALYGPTFSPWTETRNDFALGLEKAFSFNGNLRHLPASARSRATAVWSLGVSFFVQSRLRSPGPNSTALYVVPSAAYVPTRNWSISLFVSTRERWFDNAASTAATVSRRDFEIEPILTVAYDMKLPGAPQIALQASFERRSSNLPNRSWNQWAIGPVLTASWRF